MIVKHAIRNGHLPLLNQEAALELYCKKRVWHAAAVAAGKRRYSSAQQCSFGVVFVWVCSM